MAFKFNVFTGKFDVVLGKSDNLFLPPAINTFAELPSATTNTGEIFVVRNTTGVLFINRKKSGIYKSDGVTWNYFTSFTASQVAYDSTDSGLIAIDVKGALDELENQLDSHEVDIANPHNTTFTQAVTADAGTDITALETEELTDGSVTELHRHKSIIQVSGRFDLFLSNNWVSWSDAAFGLNQADWDIQLGSGATPNVDWDGNGILFPAGTLLKSITIKSRANNAQVSAVELYARVHDVDFTIGSPIDSIAEVGAVEVVAPFTQDLTNGGSNVGSDMQAFSFSLNEYTFNNIGDFHLMCRIDPGATITANRQLRCTVYLEVEYP